jgi:hypothetical protein
VNFDLKNGVAFYSSIQSGTVGAMRRIFTYSALLVMVLSANSSAGRFATASSGSSVPARCSSSALRATEPHMAIVAASTVSELFVLKNVSGRACSLSGYSGIALRLATGVRVTIPFSDKREYGGGRAGGLRKRGPLPLTILAAHGGLASFWIYGTDQDYGAPPVRCWTAPVMLLTSPSGRQSTSTRGYRFSPFYWCGRISVLPILPGRSGTYPAVPLSYYFGG